MEDRRLYPNRPQAEALLEDALADNPGPWGEHSRICAQCAQEIGWKCGLDGNFAYVLGLLHDIGRKFGSQQLGHVYNGWKYMNRLGYPQVGKICLTHAFNIPSFEIFVGKIDIPVQQRLELMKTLAAVVYDDYDRLIQLCDCLASSDGIVDMEERMLDVKRRYGSYPQEKWDKNLELKAYFDKKCGMEIYRLLTKEEF